MAQYNTVFHTLAKILPRHEIDRLDRKYGQGDKRRKSSRYVPFIMKSMWLKVSITSQEMICMDRGYTDYDWWEELTRKGVYFVTRTQIP